MLRALALVAMLLSAAAFAQSAAPRIASLTIEIWPEYDRPAALVILRGALADDVKLPASMSFRLPAASGGPTAVAYADRADGNLLNLAHEQAKSGDDVTVRFELPQRFFHVEFYEPMKTGEPSRAFRYTWPGDFAVGRASLTVQEPASAQGIVTEPELKEMSTGAGGLGYRSGDLGALPAGKALPITVRYTKSDARTSVEIRGLRTSQQASAAGAPAPAAAATSGRDVPPWLLPIVALAVLGLGAASLLVIMWRRQSAPGSSAFCTQCGAALPAGSNFCGKCGAKVGAKAAKGSR